MKFKVGDRVRLSDDTMRQDPYYKKRYIEGVISRIQIKYHCSTYTIIDYWVQWDHPKCQNPIVYSGGDLDYPKEHTDFLDKIRDRLK